jgi:hypothetical protein
VDFAIEVLLQSMSALLSPKLGRFQGQPPFGMPYKMAVGSELAFAPQFCFIPRYLTEKSSVQNRLAE